MVWPKQASHRIIAFCMRVRVQEEYLQTRTTHLLEAITQPLCVCRLCLQKPGARDSCCAGRQLG